MNLRFRANHLPDGVRAADFRIGADVHLQPGSGSGFPSTSPLYAVLMRVSVRWLRPIFNSLEEGFGKYHSHQIDAIRGIETVKSTGAERGFRQLMLNEFHAVAGRSFKADFTIMVYDGVVQAVSFLSLVLFLWVGAHQVIAGNLTIGAFVAFNSLVALANAPLILSRTLGPSSAHDGSF